MSQVEVFQTFVNDVSMATDEQQFAIAANAFAGRLGYRWFAYMRIEHGFAELLSTYPTFWTDHYLASGFEAIDPVVSLSKSEYQPFLWGHDERIRPTDRESIRLFDDAACFGIRFGVTVPLCEHDGQVAAFTLSTDETPGIAQRSEPCLGELRRCGLWFHANASSRLGRFRPHAAAHGLTTRQHACLSAVADGHSAKETARLVNLTPRTVQYHLEEAKRRLHAETLPHAVALALRGHLIS